MILRETSLPGVLVLEPRVHRDQRGYFLETYHLEHYRDAGLPHPFVQDNQSYSVRGVLRGLHGQLRHPQGKLVRVLRGAIFDVAVDARPGSPHFGRWVGLYLSAEQQHQVYVPEGFLHGFCVVGDEAEILYKCTALYDPGDEFGVCWNDPDLAIDWPLEAPIVSPKDAAAPRLAEIAPRLARYVEQAA